MGNKLVALAVAFVTIVFAPYGIAAGPDHVDITWMSIANIHYQMESFGVLTDGYITRIPESEFHGGGGGYAYTNKPWKPDVAALKFALRDARDVTAGQHPPRDPNSTRPNP